MVAKNVDEYIAEQKAAIASNEECGNSHYNLAVAYLGQKRYDEAEKELHEAVNCSPSLAEAYVQLGGICLQKGDLEGCLQYNKRSTKARAGFSVGFGNIGFVELQRGNVDEAIKALTKAISFNSQFVQAYATLANAYLFKGLNDESIAASKKAISIQPDFPIPYHNLSLAYLEKEEYKLAVENSDKAAELGYEIPPEIKKEIEKHRE